VIPEEVEVRVGVLVAVVVCAEVAVVERKVDKSITGSGKEVRIESVVLDWTTGKSVRLGFCPGNVRTGS